MPGLTPSLPTVSSAPTAYLAPAVAVKAPVVAVKAPVVAAAVPAPKPAAIKAPAVAKPQPVASVAVAPKPAVPTTSYTAAPVTTIKPTTASTSSASSTGTAQTRQQYIQGIAQSLIKQGDIDDFASKFNAALAKSPYTPATKTIGVGTTQQIPSEHLGTIASMGDDPHTAVLAGAMAVSHDPRLSEFNRLVTSADNVNKMHYNYEWGGGHNTGFQPATGSGHGSGPGVGYDCSGVISHILHMAGLLNEPLVASQFADLSQYVPEAKPGVGTGPHTITIYANATHTYANIGGTYFGTSSENRGGGAGWIGTTSENNNADFTAWHIDF